MSGSLLSVCFALLLFQSRIKALMQLDDDVGAMASNMPLLVSRCVELFLADMAKELKEVARAADSGGQAARGKRAQARQTLITPAMVSVHKRAQRSGEA